MEKLLTYSGDEVKITEKVVKAAAGNRGSGKEVMALLLNQRGNAIIVTPGLVKTLVGSLNGLAMENFLTYYGDEVKITEEVVEAVVGMVGGGNEEMMALLLNQRGNAIIVTPGLVETFAGYFDALAMEKLLIYYGDEVKITEEVVKAAAGNDYEGKEIMALLLDQRGTEVKITDEVVKVAAGNEGSGREVMALLLDQRGTEVKITEEVVKAAAGNGRSGKEVMALLLDQCGDAIIVTPGLVETLAGSFDALAMEKLLICCGDEVKITEEVVKAAAGNGSSGKEVMALLFDQRGDAIIVTPGLVETLAGSFNALAMEKLLTYYGDEVKITEEVVKAATGNEYSSKEMMALLLDQRGTEVKITEEVVKAAAGNGSSGKEVMALLLDRRGTEVNY
ncbi:hypothetical protein DL770_010981 [Monosporascus sp. CRB-9-2]|nr:hypothetical protein DL770_010981 [Monosporascus sp. CRB-9-2]